MFAWLFVFNYRLKSSTSGPLIESEYQWGWCAAVGDLLKALQWNLIRIQCWEPLHVPTVKHFKLYALIDLLPCYFLLGITRYIINTLFPSCCLLGYMVLEFYLACIVSILKISDSAWKPFWIIFKYFNGLMLLLLIFVMVSIDDDCLHEYLTKEK